MNIYVIHSSKINFNEDIYSPLLNLDTPHIFNLPHVGEFKDSYHEIRNSDLVLVFADDLTFGMGVEMAWAKELKIPIVVAAKNKITSKSMSVFDYQLIEYRDIQFVVDTINLLQSF